MAQRFEIIEHPADVGFVTYGGTLCELLENAALAMFSVGCELEAIEEREQRAIQASGADNEALLFDWLAEILAVADADGLALRRAEVTRIGEGEAQGVVYGEKFDKARHRAGTYIKAVTYHELCVEKTAEGWKARVFLDV
ncbi:MAG: archease [Acidobacteria bacterium]|nr:archease [Acidobacteriota bacterium]